ncbi:MAG: SIS domain-containing protein [Candidatus Doudnabacteria bacterium]|nr:SIS domain-containing protein [Candidatus Doudnabacteria bacterium]
MKTKQWSPEKEINRNTVGIGNWTTCKIIEHRIDEVVRVYEALLGAATALEQAAVMIVDRIRKGGRVITLGAGGSGVAGMSVMRELPQNHEPISPAQFAYAVAGGAKIFEPLGCEELEDSWDEGEAEVNRLNLTKQDVLICVSATGRTPYTRGAANQAAKRGALTIGLICQTDTELEDDVHLPIVLAIGPEMFMGATCEKAASAQKDALDAIMDAVVVRLGVTDDNRTRARLVHEKARIRAKFFGQTEPYAAAMPVPRSRNTKWAPDYRC